MNTIFEKISAMSAAEQAILERKIFDEGSADFNIFPLSTAQERLWFLSQFEPDDPAYNISAAIKLTGNLNLEIFERSFARIIERHEILRTSFHSLNGRPIQIIHNDFEFGIEKITLATPENTTEKVLEIASAEARKPFNPEKFPLLRGLVVELSADVHFAVVTLHHIVADGWSMSVLINELTALYAAALSGEPANIPDLPIQYADYAVWEKENLKEENLTVALDYWKKKLSGHLPVLQLPTDYVRPAIQKTEGIRHPVVLPARLTADIIALGKRKNATLFMVLLAALKALLYRYTNQEDICVGASIAGRTLAETEDLIGFFLNTLVMRSQPSGDLKFSEFLAAVRQTSFEAFENQAVPVEMLLETLEVERNASRNPLFQVLFILQNTPPVELKLGELKIEEVHLDTKTSKFDITFDFAEKDGRIEGWIEYATALFEPPTIERLAAHFRQFLETVVHDAEQKIGEIDYLTAEEKRELDAFQNAPKNAAADFGLHQFVSRKATEMPDAAALKFGQATLTYSELDTRSNRLANYLRESGVKPGDLVGVILKRSVEQIVSIIGILKAGAAYVPVEPNSPPERTAYIIENSRVEVLLTETNEAVSPDATVKIINIKADAEKIAAAGSKSLNLTISPEFPAYIIYTSGSTGKPKGVVVQHRAIVNFALFAADYYEINASDRVLQFASYSFDASLEEIFAAFAAGAMLVLRDEEMISTVENFRQKCVEEKITVLDLPTAYWNELLAGERIEFPDTVRLIIIGGEKVQIGQARRWQEMTGGKIRLVNSYGPTEATVVATVYEINSREPLSTRREIPIGRPVSGAQAVILDKNLKPVPVGVTGELFVGGNNLALGYVHDARLTAEKFIPNPFQNAPGKRLYRTGDAARFRADGEIEFCGRTDNQVKIRGFRVEPGEIENFLLACEGIENAAVICEPLNGFNRLAAFFTESSEPPVETAALRAELRQFLPEFMIPSVFVRLDKMPLTANGKVDKTALRSLDKTGFSETREFEKPATETETTLAAVWSEILQTGEIDRNDNFFDLGGHSLLGTRVISHVRHKFAIDLPLRALFESPTLAGLAKRIEEACGEQPEKQLPPILKLEHHAPVRLSFAQERLWFLQLLYPDKYAYNVIRPIRFRGKLDVFALERALTKLIERHESYRSVYPRIDGLGYIKVNPPAPIALEQVDLSHLPEVVREEQLSDLIHRAGQTPFDVVNGPLWRLKLYRMAEEDALLLFTEHHLVHDGWTEGRLVAEFLLLYQGEVENKPANLAELPVSYRDFAVWQRKCFEDGLFDEQISYWKNKLSGKLPELSLPTDRPRTAVETFNGDTLTRFLSPELTRRLNDFARARDATLYMILLSAFAVLLHRYSRQNDILIATSIAGRNKFELENLIGFFVNTLPMRNDLSGDPSYAEFLERTKKLCFEAFAQQDAPFEKIVEIIQPDRTLSKQSLFQVMLVLHNATSPDLILPGMEVESLRTHNSTAKFDLLFHLREEPAGIRLAMEYSTELFNEDTISRMLEHFENLLVSALDDKSAKISRLNLLSREERTKLLFDWNRTTREYDFSQSIAELFEKQVASMPDAVAVEFKKESLTYRALDARANQLAGFLFRQGVRPETRVGICLKRSPEMICAVLAVLKCGGVYVPLDASYPNERISYILDDAEVKLLITEESLLPNLPENLPSPLVLDREADVVFAGSTNRHPGIADERNLVYITYTSGSTGKPKGIGMTQRSLLNLLAWMLATTRLPARAKTLQFASLSFDVSFQDIFSTLLSGGTLLLITEDERQDIKGLAKIIAREGAHRLFIPAVALQQLAEGFCELENRGAVLSKVIAGSEQLQITPKIAQMFAELPNARLHNEYGPSEAHVVTELEMTGDPETWIKRPAVGKPISNTGIYILDRHLEPVPTGVPGELYIGGEGVARGYLTLFELTAEKFIPDPYAEKPGARMYKTGDTARFLADGDIEFLGRSDFQLKVRGFRIEPGEIEIILVQSPEISEAVVTAYEYSEFDKRLVAYVVPKNSHAPEPSALREYLRAKLPDYMIPSAFIFLDKIPLNTNGKVDRKNLPAPDRYAAASGREYAAPETELEKFAAGIWQEIIGLEKIGIDDNFFDLGGHSLLAMQVVSQLSDSLETDIPLRIIFEHPTIRELCAELTTFEAKSGDFETIARLTNRLNAMSNEDVEALLGSMSI